MIDKTIDDPEDSLQPPPRPPSPPQQENNSEVKNESGAGQSKAVPLRGGEGYKSAGSEGTTSTVDIDSVRPPPIPPSMAKEDSRTTVRLAGSSSSGECSGMVALSQLATVIDGIDKGDAREMPSSVAPSRGCELSKSVEFRRTTSPVVARNWYQMVKANSQTAIRVAGSSSSEESSGMVASSKSAKVVDGSDNGEARNRSIEVPSSVAPSRGGDLFKRAASNRTMSPGDYNSVPPHQTMAKAKSQTRDLQAGSSSSEAERATVIDENDTRDHQQETTELQSAEEGGFHSPNARAPSPGAVRIPGVNGRTADDDSGTFFVGNIPGAPDEEADIVAEEVSHDGSTEFRVAYNEGAADALEGHKRNDFEVLEVVPNKGKKRASVCVCPTIVLLLLGGLGWYVSSRSDSSSKEQFEATYAPSTNLPPLKGSKQFPLSLCQGDCDSDVDCQDGLQCFQRIGGMDVPGCSGGRRDTSATDYCIEITYMDPALHESSKKPLGRCAGDCDFNADCEDGLICFQRNGKEEVPGCFGGGDDGSNNDYCIKPGRFIESFGERLIGAPDDNFGSAVSLSSDGSIMAVGAVDIGSTGYVKIYKSVEESSWKLVATILGDNPGDRFGHVVELSGDGGTIAIGYVLDSGLQPKYSVRIRVLEGFLQASTGERRVWKEIGDIILGGFPGSWILDYSIALSGDGEFLAMGRARYDGVEDDETITVYQNEGNQWRRIQSPDPDIRLSSAVSLSKTSENLRMAVSNPSFVRVFELSNSTWLQLGQIIWEHDLGVVAISGDGSTVALTDTVPTFPCLGELERIDEVVRIFKYDPASDWKELGEPIKFESKVADSEVSLSSDGGAVAIGEPDLQGVGRVRLFRYYSFSNEWTIIDERINGHSPNGLFGSALSLAGSGDSMTMVVGAPFSPLTVGAHGSVTSYRTRLGEKPPRDVAPTSAPTPIPVAFQNSVTWRGRTAYTEGLVIGSSISLSSDGNVVAYSGMNSDAGGVMNTYKRNGTKWISSGDILGDEIGSGFGRAVSLSGDGRIVAVGNPFSNNGANSISGSVRVFKCVESRNIWSPLGSVVASDEISEEPLFGHSVSLSKDGSILAVGAPFGYGGEGSVTVFRFEDGLWIQIGEPIIGETGLYGGVGWAVSLSSNGRRLAVGANTDERNGDEAGAGRIYEFVNGGWQLLGQELLGESRHDLFGSSISLSGDGNVVAIGSVNSDSGGENAGQVLIYSYNPTTNWTVVGKPIIGKSSGDRFGSAVSLSKDGKTVAIGADSGSYVRVFEYDTENTYWREVGAAVQGNGGGNGFGAVVAMSNPSGNVTLVVGAPLAAAAIRLGKTVTIAGEVYVFEKIRNS
eukprot:scaffold13293_cov120-Cylindrotheca_fusiformis.AAC.10